MNRVLKVVTASLSVLGLILLVLGPNQAGGAGASMFVLFAIAFGLLHVKRVF